MMDLRKGMVTLAALAVGACADDGVTPGGGTSGSGSGSSSSSSTIGVSISSSTIPPGTTTGSGGTAGTTGDADTGDTTMTPEPPIFDLAVPDSPLYDPYYTDVVAFLTADSAYILGYGTSEALTDSFAAVTDPPLTEFCGDELVEYVIPPGADYFYVVAYSDQVGTQGVFGAFYRDSYFLSGPPPLRPVLVAFTGDPQWEVCATGLSYHPDDPAPLPGLINEQIGLCNMGSTDPFTTSQGWVDQVGTPLGALAVGEYNATPLEGEPQPGNEFPPVCADFFFPDEARWMWFNWDPEDIEWPTQSPFLHPDGDDNPAHEFLIFRLPQTAVPA